MCAPDHAFQMALAKPDVLSIGFMQIINLESLLYFKTFLPGVHFGCHVANVYKVLLFGKYLFVMSNS